MMEEFIFKTYYKHIKLNELLGCILIKVSVALTVSFAATLLHLNYVQIILPSISHHTTNSKFSIDPMGDTTPIRNKIRASGNNTSKNVLYCQ